jgi:hypothetical protein
VAAQCPCCAARDSRAALAVLGSLAIYSVKSRDAAHRTSNFKNACKTTTLDSHEQFGYGRNQSLTVGGASCGETRSSAVLTVTTGTEVTIKRYSSQ